MASGELLNSAPRNFCKFNEALTKILSRIRPFMFLQQNTYNAHKLLSKKLKKKLKPIIRGNSIKQGT